MDGGKTMRTKLFIKTSLWLIILLGIYSFIKIESIKKEEELALKESMTDEEYLEKQDESPEEKEQNISETISEKAIENALNKNSAKDIPKEDIIVEKVPRFLIRKYSEEEKQSFLDFAKESSYIVDGQIEENGSVIIELTEEQRKEALKLLKEFK